MTTIYEIEQQAFLGPKQGILNILIIIYTFFNVIFNTFALRNGQEASSRVTR